MSSDDPRLEALESQVAFQEDALRELSDALIAQQLRIDQLTSQVLRLTERLDTAGTPGDGMPEPPPPHY